MTHERKAAIGLSTARRLAAVCAIAVAAGAQATVFELTYTGTFNTEEALNLASATNPTNFSDTTPFTIIARFDDSSPNLAPNFGGPFNGFRAYAPLVATIEIAGTRYGMETILTNPLAGVSIAIFDRNSFVPGRYGIGLLADPVGDGAGIVGDFVSASPDFTVSQLVPTRFVQYFGVGHGSGVCESGSPPDCTRKVTPWVLHDAGNQAWNLTLSNYEEDFPDAHTSGATVGPLNTAQIAAVPEPSIYALMLAGLSGFARSVRRGPRRDLGIG